nr:MAG TPA: hypothetical protein [Caudoviricetes sp.]
MANGDTNNDIPYFPYFISIIYNFKNIRLQKDIFYISYIYTRDSI